MQEKKKKNLFKLKPKITWGQLNGTYVQRLYMHEDVAPMVENIETPCTKCINIDDVNKGIKKMASRKTTYVTRVSLLKWTRPHTRHWILTIIEQAIKQGFPNDWLMNWIKPIFKSGDKNHYRTIMVNSTIANLYNTIMEQKISTWAKTISKRELGQA